jgi:hypothetical protein
MEDSHRNRPNKRIVQARISVRDLMVEMSAKSMAPSVSILIITRSEPVQVNHYWEQKCYRGEDSK